MSIKKARYNWLILICLFAFNWQVVGQQSGLDIRPKFNSPFSRFGLGDMVDQNFANTSGMGGISTAYINSYHLNMANPASLAFLRETAFDIGFYGYASQLKENDKDYTNGGGNLRYLALGFPLKNAINQTLDQKNSPWQFGMAFSLSPFTESGYNIETNSGTSVGESTTSSYLKGTGSTYRLKWGNAVRYNGLSFGVNAHYTFGKLVNSSIIVFDSLAYSYYTEFQEGYSINSLGVDLGVQYILDFKKNTPSRESVKSGKRLILGAVMSPKSNFTSYTDKLHYRDEISLFPNETSVDFAVRDTFLFENDVDYAGTFPLNVSFGVTYEEINKLKVGIEYTMTQWSSYTNAAKPENLLNSWRIGAGLEYTPEINSFNNYSKTMQYRLGFFHQTDPRSFSGEQIKHTAITAGLGFPIILPRKGVSYMDMGIEAGKRGIDGLLTENYIKLNIGFTLNDNSWFFKRKFN